MGRGKVWLGAVMLIVALAAPDRGHAEEPGSGAPAPVTRAAENQAGGASGAPPVWIFLERWLWAGDIHAPDYPMDEAADLLWEPALHLRFPGRVTSAYRETPKAGGTEPNGGLLVDLAANATTRLWSGQVRAEGHVTALEADLPVPPEERHDAPRFGQLRLVGQWDWFELGVQGYSVTPGLETVTSPRLPGDEDAVQTWLETRLGPARVKGYLVEKADNAVDDPRRGRTTRTEAGLSIQASLPAGSLLTVGYAHGVSEPSPPERQREAAAGEARSYDKVHASLYYYGGETWDATLGATATPSRDAKGGREILASTYDLSLTYRPSGRLGLTPILGFSNEEYRWSGTGTRTLFGALSLWYVVRRDLDASVYADYARSYLSDGLYDGRTLTASTSLVWHLRRDAPARTSLAFDFGYTRYLDTASSYGSADLYGIVVLRIVGF